ncbi:hypothetical protein PFICI_07106 [Pestalotiopsis fici W106-1]|uniref:Uncharacterized protein n=1 Tax=Pestalotiopsis fici (strain W106-1 / CGMCC3.15140) TaxID=1229662 RepID=W3X7U7_PESFW|nr:uncharacterized protein PFICI_07106 [Pestalotiopsis fici W106-1]ETS82104.1 hypothetical protein PFICI_07106 [Pestalotiopsis fici W106-1]
MEKALLPKHRWYPEASLMHADGGNSGSTDWPGPVGLNTSSSSSALDAVGVLLWGSNHTMVVGYVDMTTNPITLGLVVRNATTLQVLGQWPAPANETLNLAYIELIAGDASDRVIVSSQQGRIYSLSISHCPGSAKFTMDRKIDLSLGDILSEGETLLNAMVDTDDNIWFTTGYINGTSGLTGGSTASPNSTTLGFVTPDNAIKRIHIAGQVVENGIAVSGTTSFIVMGPTDGINATGYLAAYRSDEPSNGGIDQVWKLPYSAGSTTKPGAFSRGSGSTPALLGDQFVAVTDNADGQINLIVAHQNTTTNQLACKVPLFMPGSVANDFSATVHFDGTLYSVMLINNYGAPQIFSGQGSTDINGSFNNKTMMPGGLTRVDVDTTGAACGVRWVSNITTTAVPILSTATGLLYVYSQDPGLALKGEYVWYLVAVSWDTGDVAWKVKMGSGGIFNDNWLSATLGPDGTFYQWVIGGLAMVKDFGSFY